MVGSVGLGGSGGVGSTPEVTIHQPAAAPAPAAEPAAEGVYTRDPTDGVRAEAPVHGQTQDSMLADQLDVKVLVDHASAYKLPSLTAQYDAAPSGSRARRLIKRAGEELQQSSDPQLRKYGDQISQHSHDKEKFEKALAKPGVSGFKQIQSKEPVDVPEDISPADAAERKQIWGDVKKTMRPAIESVVEDYPEFFSSARKEEIQDALDNNDFMRADALVEQSLHDPANVNLQNTDGTVKADYLSVFSRRLGYLKEVNGYLQDKLKDVRPGSPQERTLNRYLEGSGAYNSTLFRSLPKKTVPEHVAHLEKLLKD